MNTDSARINRSLINVRGNPERGTNDEDGGRKNAVGEDEDCAPIEIACCDSRSVPKAEKRTLVQRTRETAGERERDKQKREK